VACLITAAAFTVDLRGTRCSSTVDLRMKLWAGQNSNGFNAETRVSNPAPVDAA